MHQADIARSSSPTNPFVRSFLRKSNQYDVVGTEEKFAEDKLVLCSPIRRLSVDFHTAKCFYALPQRVTFKA